MDSEPTDDVRPGAAAAFRPELPRAGQVALVTGGSAGLGLSIAAALARAGSDVVLASRSAERCRRAAAQLSAETGRTAAGHGCDVTDEDAITGLVDRVLTEHGRLDVLVTSAGVQARGTLEQLDVAVLRACLDDPQMLHFLSAEIPLGRWADFAELAGAALLLTDPQAGYLTGAVLPVDGGWTAH